MLEICPASEGKGATENYFDQYIHLTGPPRLKGDDTSGILKSTVDMFSKTVDGFSKTLKDTVGSVVERDYKSVDLNSTVDVFSKTVDGFSKTLQDTVGGVVELDAMMKDVSKTQKEFAEKIRVACEKEKELEAKQEQLQEEKDQLQKEIQLMSEINKIQDSCIKLNVGGHIHTTSTLTLTKEPLSMLAAMFSGRHSVKAQEDGSYFIDRDGTHFRYILNYLRGNAISV